MTSTPTSTHDRPGDPVPTSPTAPPTDARTAAPTGTRAARYRDGVRTLAGLQKTSKGAPAYSRYVNRWLGRRLAAAAHVVGLTPNAVTGLSALCSFAAIAAVALVRPTPVVGVLVALGLVVGYALDSADGQLARLTGTGSPAGEWLDHVVDVVKTATMHLAVAVSLHRFTDLDDAWLLVPLVWSVVAVVSFFAMTLTDQLRRAARGRSGQFMAKDGSSSLLYSLAVSPTDYGLLCLVFVALAWTSAFLALYGLLLVACAGFLALALPKWYREIRRTGAAGEA
ncbi:CDP-alcohol phosphatidyltransferase family protein [Cellulomonas marina]|uniref:CDP-alcohol phosphatidyltransferase n=1 Tax=Cellulomonas marina TaxID=988821 RepID=A0A1I0X3Q1_9CELL|nr:CDP-alcohol phosphatidyltransferase family protein [Cellulomonas marina]GIG28923.1 CDP-alcohol phosphatidyltransferase [Cellulomonas marina]SFA95551.1 CDP-alcohol phosphatidyltransferase [Cellulomonas marina]